jgi:hypothetical protein
MEVLPPKRPFLQGPYSITSQKTPFFIVTVMKTSNGMEKIRPVADLLSKNPH